MCEYLLFIFVFSFSLMVKANCDVLEKQFPSKTDEFSACSDISDATDGYNLVSIHYGGRASENSSISLWMVRNNNAKIIYKSSNFTMPFEGCCMITKKGKNIFLFGESDSVGSISSNTYQIQNYKGSFRVITYHACEKRFNSENDKKSSICINWNLLTGKYNLEKRENNILIKKSSAKKYQAPVLLKNDDFFGIIDLPDLYWNY